jgi:hypothetical protein
VTKPPCGCGRLTTATDLGLDGRERRRVSRAGSRTPTPRPRTAVASTGWSRRPRRPAACTSPRDPNHVGALAAASVVGYPAAIFAPRSLHRGQGREKCRFFRPDLLHAITDRRSSAPYPPTATQGDELGRPPSGLASASSVTVWFIPAQSSLCSTSGIPAATPSEPNVCMGTQRYR